MAFPKNNEVEFGMGTVPQGNRCINDMETCTYDESHVVAGGKFSAHMAECSKKNKGSRFVDQEMTVCPHDPTHHVKSSVLEMHIEMCDAFYKYSMEHQELPESLAQSLKRFKMEEMTPKGQDDSHQVAEVIGLETETDDEVSEDERDFNKCILGGNVVELVTFEGIKLRPATYQEYKAAFQELTDRLVQERLEGVKIYPPKHSFQEIVKAFPDITEEEFMAEVKKYSKTGKFFGFPEK